MNKYVPFKNNKLIGKVISGKGEGKKYMALKPYKEKFKKLVGFEPYEGTLNIKINPIYCNKIENPNNCNNHDTDNNKDNNSNNIIIMEDFNYKNKKYYGVKLRHIIIYNKKTNIGVKGAIVIPKKTEHSNTTLEIIAPIKLRKYLSLKNNSIVEIKL